eukprot:7886328-Alexandrium_andersonii.AAC.1
MVLAPVGLDRFDSVECLGWFDGVGIVPASNFHSPGAGCLCRLWCWHCAALLVHLLVQRHRIGIAAKRAGFVVLLPLATT